MNLRDTFLLMVVPLLANGLVMLRERRTCTLADGTHVTCETFMGVNQPLQQSCTRRSIDFCSAWRQFDEECAFLTAAGVATPHRVRRR
ncbi:hypothetical protein ABT369_10050 [Dactylosporangium sp. NPDC000244]|uniref:hypothetical protein n=1 Tax=Dactylosporangium sp. NPDC000244 TaxID=3154365 RepID=UPI00331F1B1E